MHYWSLAAVSAGMAAGRVSALEVTRGTLDRIARLNPTLGAFYTVFADSALEEARTADVEIAESVPWATV